MVNLKVLIGIGAVVVIAGVYLVSRSNKKDKNTQEDSINIILTDENRYEEDKSLIEDAIKTEDWEFLEDMRTSRTADFPDLILMIDNALKARE